MWSCCPSLQWFHTGSGKSAAHGCPVESSQDGLMPEGCQGPTETGKEIKVGTGLTVRYSATSIFHLVNNKLYINYFP